MKIEFMHCAIAEARKALENSEVPVGAIVVRNSQVIGRGYNQREKHNDPTAHAEILAIRQAASYLGSWRLTDCEIYVTLEPCPMCAGAIVNSRIQTIVYGAYDLKSGAVNSLYNILSDKRLNHQVEIYSGICEELCQALLKEFFDQLRN